MVAGAIAGTVGALLVRDWMAARRLGFSVLSDGTVEAVWRAIMGADQRGCPQPLRSIRSSRQAPGERALAPLAPNWIPHTVMRENEAAPSVSVVVPVKNEAGNIAPLVAEIERALAGTAFEIVYVNDGSTDGTEAELASLKASRPWLRQIKHAASCGQSSAVRTGVKHARAPLVATLDGDGQNDPAFVPKLLAVLAEIRASVSSPDNASAARIPASRNFSPASPTAYGARCCAMARATPAAG